MQIIARSRSPPALRARSRSGSPRRQWNEDVSISHSQGVRRLGGPVQWKTEDDLRGIPPAGGMYSTQPAHRTIIRDELSGPIGTTGRSPMLGSEDTSWEKMMTFRTFVIDRTNEETESNQALVAYENYKQNFTRAFTGRLFRQLKDIPVLAEKYDAELVFRQLEETTQRCRLSASEFMKLLAEERFLNITLSEPYQEARPITATNKPFRLLVGPRVLQEPNYSSLSDPFFIPEDPDTFCLMLRNLPSHISKWDLHEHLASVGAVDGLVDLTLIVPDGSQLTPSASSELVRTAWMKYNAEDACAAAEIKLEGTNFKRYTCRPIRRVPDISSYTVRVAPSETCHPARVERDLRLSARLIVKLDDTFGVSELLGVVSNEAEKEVLTEARCQQHPVLSDLPNVLQGSINRTPLQQLDLQLLYLRVVHCVCYYSGRRFLSPREVWDVVGPLYVRPTVLQEEVLSLPGFNKPGGELNQWDSDYTTAVDIFQKMQESPLVTETTAYDDTEYFLKDETVHYSFEPSKASPALFPKEEQTMVDTSLIKVENVDGLTSSIGDSSITDQKEIQMDTKLVVIKTENESSSTRGRHNPWLLTLDSRIVRLLKENFNIPRINEDHEEVKEQWTEFCNANMTEVEAEKWRCSLCKKLFRGADFVHKHLKNKHSTSLTPIIDKVKLKYMCTAHQDDPFRLPVHSPKPIPYLYRTAYLRQQRRQESPALGPVMGGPAPLNLSASASVFPTFMPGVGGSRLGGVHREYRDLDAPRPTVTANGNLRVAIQYDDLL